MAGPRASQSNNNIYVILLLSILIISSSIITGLQALSLHYEVPLKISKIYAVKHTPSNTLLMASDSGIYYLNIDDGSFYELPIKTIYDLENISEFQLVGVGESSGKAHMLFFNQSGSTTSLKYLVSSALYDVVVINDTIFSSGYVQVNSTYKGLINIINSNSFENYVIDCQTSCFGRKLMVTEDHRRYLFGSIYTKGKTYQWNYDVFIGILGTNTLFGRSIGLEGNDYVVNSLYWNNSTYLLINSDLLGLHIAIIDSNSSISIYKILVGGASVIGNWATQYKDLLLIGVRERSREGNGYLVLLNTTSLELTSYYLGSNSLEASVSNEYIVFLNNSLDYGKTKISIYSFDDLFRYLRMFDTRSAVIISVNAYITDFEVVLNKYDLGFESSVDSSYPSLINITIITTKYDVLNTSTYLEKPQYVLRSAESSWSRVSILILGLILLLSSIILKFLMRLEVRE
ncbi:MAG: hypothetical protein QXO98_00410 [Sulfolobales archaeon]